jgi:hypothetical protein
MLTGRGMGKGYLLHSADSVNVRLTSTEIFIASGFNTEAAQRHALAGQGNLHDNNDNFEVHK